MGGRDRANSLRCNALSRCGAARNGITAEDAEGGAEGAEDEPCVALLSALCASLSYG